MPHLLRLVQALYMTAIVFVDIEMQVVLLLLACSSLPKGLRPNLMCLKFHNCRPLQCASCKQALDCIYANQHVRSACLRGAGQQGGQHQRQQGPVPGKVLRRRHLPIQTSR